MSKNLNDWIGYNKNKNYQRSISSKPKLHNNSIELVNTIKKHNFLNDGDSVFEVGCGSGRNLDYLIKSFQNVVVMGNDLVRKECFKYMGGDLKDKIKFFEIDTLSLFKQEDIKVKLMIVSDHFMHLDNNTYHEVSKFICEKWKPMYLLIRDGRDDRTSEPPKYAHNFYVFKSHYELIEEYESATVGGYDIYLYKINKD